MNPIKMLSSLPGLVHGTPAKPADVTRLEKRLGVKLPEAYRSFLLQWGWVWLELGANTIYGLPKAGDPQLGADADCIEATERERDPGQGCYPRGPLSNDSVVIAEDGAGGIIVLKALEAPDAGQVVWLDPEAEVERWPGFEEYLSHYLDQYL